MPPLLQDAWYSLKRNPRDVLLYAGAQCGLLIAANIFEYLLGITLEDPPPWLPAYNFILSLILSAANSAIMAVVFARLGEDIDRPLWRCQSDAEALQRFFVPWLIINLALTTLLRLWERSLVAEMGDLAGLLFVLILIATGLSIPAGACVMYHGRLRWPEIGIALRPISAKIELSLAVMGVLWLQFFLFFFSLLVQPDPANFDGWAAITLEIFFRPIIAIPIVLLDCLAFAMMWRICMILRDEGVDDLDPYDF